MEEITNQDIVTIQQVDPYLPSYIDFDKLRKEGLEHLGNLAGKIWTDHNVHDPGITILETLIYAIMDLGYRTNLPFEKLIALQAGQEEDNFLTPQQILTCNPTTITDYRKLLLEVDGVRNAWLEPTKQEVPLYINRDELSCIPRGFEQQFDTVAYGNIKGFNSLELNGLYKVLIEKDAIEVDNTLLIEEVRQTMAAYRNLCEDTVAVEILNPIPVGVCATIEIHAGFDENKIYVEVMNRIKNLIQPELQHYTLQELLDKGKPIEEIFAGRPYLEASIGFVDTEELESYDLKEALYLSDFYNIILNVEGVRSVKEIRLVRGDVFNQPTLNWVEGIQIQEGNAPYFSLEDTCIDLVSAQGALRIDKSKLNKSLANPARFDMPNELLDVQLPLGAYPEDLGSYYSIQNDFPVVYGIGEDGLPQRATLERKTQALQLKGYLMFFDQILANYSAQLANIRNVFSLKPESQRTEEEKSTYHTQIPESVPGLQNLLRFYGITEGTIPNTTLAVPIAKDQTWYEALHFLEQNPQEELIVGNYCNGGQGQLETFTFSSSNARAVYINQWVRSFQKENYQTQFHQDKKGHFFSIIVSPPEDLILLGTKRYATEQEAMLEVKNVTFIASMIQNYQLVTQKSQDGTVDQHYLSITYNPLSYVDLLKELNESSEEYTNRRKQFLDHLLARFGETFSDYAILQYRNATEPSVLKHDCIDKQSSYLHNFAPISRNRSKAFDYTEPSWNTDNLSGFEKRVAALSGIDHFKRQNLCNFDVIKSFRIKLSDHLGNSLLQSNHGYETLEEARKEGYSTLSAIRNPQKYPLLEKRFNGFKITNICRLFSEIPSDEQIVVSKYYYYQQLRNIYGEVVAKSKSKRMGSEKSARDKEQDFINKIQEQQIVISSPCDTYRLIPLEHPDQYLNVAAIAHRIDTLVSWKWHVQNVSADVTPQSCDQATNTAAEAWEGMIEQASLEPFLTKHPSGISWHLQIGEALLLKSRECYPDENSAIAAWRRAKVLGSSVKNFSIVDKEEALLLQLKNEKGCLIAETEGNGIAVGIEQAVIEKSVAVFSDNNTQPIYHKEKDQFGFQIFDQKEKPILNSYCVYSTPVAALQAMELVYEQGKKKQQYIVSGDEGNPVYNFIIQDAQGSFAAVLPNSFETKEERDKVLKETQQYFKVNTTPIYVKEEPRRYRWCFEEKIPEERSENVFSTKARAQADFEKMIATAISQDQYSSLHHHIYTFGIVPIPAQYQFIYGDSTADDQINPIFVSNQTFGSKEQASEAYTSFIQKLPGSRLARVDDQNTAFELYHNDAKEAIATSAKDASINRAQELISYLNQVFQTDGSPNQTFVDRQMIPISRDGSIQWRFYQKNVTLAQSLFRCSSEGAATEMKRLICDQIAPITFDSCPPKPRVVCPEKDPTRFHYQICFYDQVAQQTFQLISYVGYNTETEAEAAWEKDWNRVITIAKDKNQYGEGKRISKEEIYFVPNGDPCHEETYIAVITESSKEQIESQGYTLEDYYARLAQLYPIFVEEDLEEEGERQYGFKVIISESIRVPEGCNHLSKDIQEIWLGPSLYTSVDEAIQAYEFAISLMGTPNNCKVFCQNGIYYIGLIEVLAESSGQFYSEQEAWDNYYPQRYDDCGECIVGGVREFSYAADEEKNYVLVQEQSAMSFKIVSPHYFMVDHNCQYHSETERDDQVTNHWIPMLKELDWDKYIPYTPYGYSNTQFCDVFLELRETIEKSENRRETVTKEEAMQPMEVRHKADAPLLSSARHHLAQFESISQAVDYFPVYKVEGGYRFRIYYPPNDQDTTPDGLDPCGCGDKVDTTTGVCCNPYPFVSSNVYACCDEALNAFIKLCVLIKEDVFTIAPVTISEYGPYSFQIVDQQKELAYHPQQYDSYQKVKDAIQRTKNLVDATGMHLVEHILLRPQDLQQCREFTVLGNSCFLPICPDYGCQIEWKPDMDKDDPCAGTDIDLIHYIPGTDPYSFWATVALPAWDKRFRTLEQREAYERFLYKETPALVALNILWLSPQNMCLFEEAYRNWLLWKEGVITQSCNPNDLSPTCQLVKYIGELESEPVCDNTSSTSGDCNCNSVYYDQGYPNISTNTTESLFWGQCDQEPIGEYETFASVAEIDKNLSNVSKKIESNITEEQTGTAAKTKVTEKKDTKESEETDQTNNTTTYIEKIEQLVDASTKKTKSYQRAIDFLNKTVDISAYKELTDYYKKYSLQSDSKKEIFFGIIIQTSCYLLDTLIKRETPLKEEENTELQEIISGLVGKGLSVKLLKEEWNSRTLATKPNSETLSQINKLLK